jgi:hypothetical protein
MNKPIFMRAVQQPCSSIQQQSHITWSDVINRAGRDNDDDDDDDDDNDGWMVTTNAVATGSSGMVFLL